MKRFFYLFLCLCLFLPGCSGELMKNPVTFYYPRREYQYGAEDGVISSEQREASGHADDLHYLLSLYLIGPSRAGLSPAMGYAASWGKPAGRHHHAGADRHLFYHDGHGIHPCLRLSDHDHPVHHRRGRGHHHQRKPKRHHEPGQPDPH